MEEDGTISRLKGYIDKLKKANQQEAMRIKQFMKDMPVDKVTMLQRQICLLLLDADHLDQVIRQLETYKAEDEGKPSPAPRRKPLFIRKLEEEFGSSAQPQPRPQPRQRTATAPSPAKKKPLPAAKSPPPKQPTPAPAGPKKRPVKQHPAKAAPTAKKKARPASPAKKPLPTAAGGGGGGGSGGGGGRKPLPTSKGSGGKARELPVKKAAGAPKKTKPLPGGGGGGGGGIAGLQAKLGGGIALALSAKGGPPKKYTPLHEEDWDHGIPSSVSSLIVSMLGVRDACALACVSSHWCQCVAASRSSVKREPIINELAESEQKYRQDLNVATSEYRQSLVAYELVDDAVASALFANVDMLLTYSDELGKALTAAVASLSGATQVAPCFLNVAPLFASFKSYCQSFDTAAATLSGLCDKKGVTELLTTIPSTSEGARGLTLQACLSLPPKRMARYVDLLTQLLECTPESHADHKGLQQVLAKATEVAEYAERNVGTFEDALDLYRIQSSVNSCPNLSQAGRRVLLDGNVVRTQSKRMGRAPASRLVLLTDALLVANRHGVNGWKFANLLLLRSLWTRVLERGMGAGSKGSHEFELISPAASLIVATKSKEERTMWVAAIGEAIEALIEEEPSLAASRESNVPSLPKYDRVRCIRVRGAPWPVGLAVKPHVSSLNQEDSFVVDAGARIFVWQGQQSSKQEWNRAVGIARRASRAAAGDDDSVSKCAPIGVLAWNTDDPEFWGLLGGTNHTDVSDTPNGVDAAAGGGKNKTEWSTTYADAWSLHRVLEGAVEKESLSAGQALSRTQLASTHSYVLDTGKSGLWVWHGCVSTENTRETTNLQAEVLAGARERRETLEGQEDAVFTALFVDWPGCEAARAMGVDTVMDAAGSGHEDSPVHGGSRLAKFRSQAGKLGKGMKAKAGGLFSRVKGKLGRGSAADGSSGGGGGGGDKPRIEISSGGWSKANTLEGLLPEDVDKVDIEAHSSGLVIKRRDTVTGGGGSDGEDNADADDGDDANEGSDATTNDASVASSAGDGDSSGAKSKQVTARYPTKTRAATTTSPPSSGAPKPRLPTPPTRKGSRPPPPRPQRNKPRVPPSPHVPRKEAKAPTSPPVKKPAATDAATGDAASKPLPEAGSPKAGPSDAPKQAKKKLPAGAVSMFGGASVLPSLGSKGGSSTAQATSSSSNDATDKGVQYIFCDHCGTKNVLGDAVFCDDCGERLVEEEGGDGGDEEAPAVAKPIRQRAEDDAIAAMLAAAAAQQQPTPTQRTKEAVGAGGDDNTDSDEPVEEAPIAPSAAADDSSDEPNAAPDPSPVLIAWLQDLGSDYEAYASGFQDIASLSQLKGLDKAALKSRGVGKLAHIKVMLNAISLLEE